MHRPSDGDPAGLQNELVAWSNARRRHAQPNDAGSYNHPSRERLAAKLKHRSKRAVAVTSVFPDYLQLEVWRIRKTIF